MGAAVLVGTQKGLFVLTSDETRRDWWVEGPHLTGFEVLHAMRDPQLRPLVNATSTVRRSTESRAQSSRTTRSA